MRSRHLVDPELLAGLELLPSFDFSDAVMRQVRMGMAETLAAVPIPELSQGSIEERTIKAEDGHDIGVIIHVAAQSPAAQPAILHIHGGGYIIGSPRMMVDSNQRMASDVRCVVVSVDYRLAPETPHPGPLEDCYTALKWMHDNADALNIDPSRIAVAGESAGGGLAAALALMARDKGEIRLRHQHLIYPMLDDRTCVAEPHPFTGEFVWTRESNRFGWSALLGCEPGSEGVSSYAAAARAEDLTGLPDTFILVGALDLFVEEDVEFARRLMRTGVPTELHVYPGTYHGFQFVSDATVTKAAYDHSIAALRRVLQPA